jgi:hypothetical protein
MAWKTRSERIEFLLLDHVPSPAALHLVKGMHHSTWDQVGHSNRSDAKLLFRWPLVPFGRFQPGRVSAPGVFWSKRASTLPHVSDPEAGAPQLSANNPKGSDHTSKRINSLAVIYITSGDLLRPSKSQAAGRFCVPSRRPFIRPQHIQNNAFCRKIEARRLPPVRLPGIFIRNHRGVSRWSGISAHTNSGEIGHCVFARSTSQSNKRS